MWPNAGKFEYLWLIILRENSLFFVYNFTDFFLKITVFQTCSTQVPSIHITLLSIRQQPNIKLMNSKSEVPVLPRTKPPSQEYIHRTNVHCHEELHSLYNSDQQPCETCCIIYLCLGQYYASSWRGPPSAWGTAASSKLCRSPPRTCTQL